MNERQKTLFEFVSASHGDQKRKYTGDPYTNHLLAVAEMASAYSKDPLAYEKGLCHDLLEDTGATEEQLFLKLREIGYTMAEADSICECVRELTDVYTKEKYPDRNRRERKLNEAQRLGMITPDSQTVKYADLINNTESIVEHDPDFSKTYLEEKLQTIDYMRGGNIHLFVKCCHTLHEAANKLNYHIFNRCSTQQNYG